MICVDDTFGDDGMRKYFFCMFVCFVLPCVAQQGKLPPSSARIYFTLEKFWQSNNYKDIKTYDDFILPRKYLDLSEKEILCKIDTEECDILTKKYLVLELDRIANRDNEIKAVKEYAQASLKFLKNTKPDNKKMEKINGD